MLDAGELCNREVVVIGPDEQILAAARLMRDHRVGSLVVVEGPPAARRPIGMLTDRDIVVYAVAAGGAIPNRPVRACMNPDVVTAHERDSLLGVIRLMRGHGVRRLPIVDGAGVLQGILSVDDVVDFMASEMRELADLMLRPRTPAPHAHP